VRTGRRDREGPAWAGRRGAPWAAAAAQRRELRATTSAQPHEARAAMGRFRDGRFGGDPAHGPRPLGLALVIAFVQVVGTRAIAYGELTNPLVPYAYLLLVAGPLALVVRDRWPFVALAGALAATTAYFAHGYPVGPTFIAALVAVFGALRIGKRLLTWLAVAAAYGSYVYLAWPHLPLRQIVLTGVWCLVVLGFGEVARSRSAHYAEIAKARIEQQRRARAEAERAHQEQERRQASEERLLIARELHDVLGHHLSLINVQAGVGLHLMDERPEQARAALAAIKHASAEALRETRAVLAALNPRDQTAPRAPTPGLADLDALVAEVTAAGLPVSVRAEGTPRPLPAEVDRAAYRIVQEALTNVRRHAGPSASACILIAYLNSAVIIDVSDDGEGPPASTMDGGNGIAGMRERALALGGSVEAGPRSGGGFRVRAELPIVEEIM
jgi:signal transduction histidine kinase